MKDLPIFEIEIDLDFFIEAVEFNNQYNNGKWSDWASGKEIIDVYTSTEGAIYKYTEDRELIESKLNEYMLTR